ncbi:BF3164 family lipoprotein [Cyclobacterium xiamenense]|uniref:BF3164 family lipoprotein n=1 Tax=Cyclobacterium xiamenense TaxID=1297121 RepID=UPI0035CFD60D
MEKNTAITLILLGIFSLFYGCHVKEDTHELVNFDISVNMKGEPVEEIPIYASGNVYLMVMDTFLIILTHEEKFFKVYSTQSYQLLGEFGDRGDGPSEFNLPYLSKEIWCSGGPPRLNQVYDMRLNRHYSVPLMQALIEGDYEGKPVRETNSQILNFYFKTENYLLCTTQNQKGRFLHHNYKTGKSKVIPYIPKTEFSIEDEDDLYWVYRSAVMVNKQEGLVAAAPLLLGQIDFFDMEGNYLRTTQFEKPDQLKENLDRMKVEPNLFEPKVYISDIDASERLIYGLSMNNLGKHIGDSQLQSPHKILVFDWEGNPVKEYVLGDGRYVFSIAVDEKNKRIYAYCPNENENNLVMYSFP